MYTETTSLKLKKPAVGTPGADWPGYISEALDTIDTQVENSHKKNADVLPDADATRSIGSSIRRFLSGFFSSGVFNEIILGGVSRTAWPSAGSGSQSMDDTYNNGSVINVDNTNEVHQLTTGKKWKLTDASGAVTYMEAEGGKGITFVPFSLQNLLGNSPFGAWSNATPENVGSAIYSDTDGSTYAAWAGTNCNVTDGGANLLLTLASATGYANYPCSGLTVGELYKATIVVANGTGTWGAGDKLRIYNNALAAQIAAIDITGPGTFSVLWRATEANNRILPSLLGTHTDSQNFNITSITLYKITPGCVAQDTKGPDGWIKYSPGNFPAVYREYNGVNTKAGSFYALKIISDATGSGYVQWPGTDIAVNSAKFAGRAITLGCWVKTSVANKARIQITDLTNGISSYSSYHSGGGSYEWLEATQSVSSTCTSLSIHLEGGLSNTAYFSQPALVFGPSIGQGNYSPRPDEIIWTETPIALSSLDSKTSLSTTSATAIDIGADASGLIGKGAKAVFVSMEATDSGGAGADCKVTLGPSSANQPFACSPAGLANSRTARAQGWVPLAADGTLTYVLTATGSATLAIPKAKITGIQY
jgi:hypothetical protein